MQNQADVLYSFRLQNEFRSLDRNPPFFRLAEWYQLRANNFTYVGALPISCDKKIVHICQSANASRERSVKIFKIFGTPRNLTSDTLNNRQKILRTMGKLEHDVFDMPLMTFAHCQVGA